MDQLNTLVKLTLVEESGVSMNTMWRFQVHLVPVCVHESLSTTCLGHNYKDKVVITELKSALIVIKISYPVTKL